MNQNTLRALRKTINGSCGRKFAYITLAYHSRRRPSKLTKHGRHMSPLRPYGFSQLCRWDNVAVWALWTFINARRQQGVPLDALSLMHVVRSLTDARYREEYGDETDTDADELRVILSLRDYLSQSDLCLETL